MEDKTEGRSHDREDSQGPASLEKAARPESILRNTAKGNGTSLYRRVREYREFRNLQVHLLWAALISVGGQISFRLRLAQFLRPRQQRCRRGGIRHQPRDAANRGEMQPMRRSSWTRV